MRYAMNVVVMFAGAAIGGATAVLHWPVWGYLVAAVVFAIGLAMWPRVKDADSG